jgi:UDP-N-acetylglucosamine 2-epimerase (non-hydrolysing)
MVGPKWWARNGGPEDGKRAIPPTGTWSRAFQVVQARVIVVAGARPNFVKVAPIIRALKATGSFSCHFVHTGQHYTRTMSQAFIDELGLPRPDINLNVGSSSHAKQTAAIMERFETTVREVDPRLVIVVGDVNSTLACALTAKKLGVDVAHVEAGLRSFDRTMPEEINRVVTDAISDYLFVSEESGVANLVHEGIDASRVFHVGNVMIDTLVAQRPKAQASPILDDMSLQKRGYALLTLHRPGNVDDTDTLAAVCELIDEVASLIPVVFPCHPRTRERLKVAGLMPSGRGTTLIEPVGYIDFLRLMMSAALVLTDSGGIQEETAFLGVPCLTLRENTERPATLACGTNTVVGLDREKVIAGTRAALSRPAEGFSVPPLWDGKASSRIVEILERQMPDLDASGVDRPA